VSLQMDLQSNLQVSQKVSQHVKTEHWFDILVKPAADLPAAARLRLFREGRLCAAALVICLFPLLAFTSREPVAVTASLLLFALLPAVIAIDVRRPARLGRATMLSMIIMAAVLTGGVLRGLPPAAALMLICLAALEAFLASRHAGRMMTMAAALAGIAAVSLAAQFAPSSVGSAGSSLAMAALALCSTVMLTRGIGLVYHQERLRSRQDRALSGEIAAVVSETVLAVDMSGRVIRVSANSERVLGLSSMDLMGRGLAELTLVGDRPLLLTAFSDSAAAAPRQKHRIRLRQTTDDVSPRYRWAEITIVPSAMVGIAIASLRDVSTDVVEEERLDQAAKEAESAKIARSAFLATVNHELRTPLNAIIGFSEILANPLTGPTDPERVREYAAIVHGAGQDLLRMVSAMIDVTRIDAGIYDFEAEDMDVAVLVNAAVEAFQAEPDARGESFTVIPLEKALHARVDARAFRSVLHQIFSNAAKFGKGRGIEVTLARTQDCVCVCIRDGGDGIAADKLDLLGKHFARLDDSLNRANGGVGLGLSLARGLMALHGGKIMIESTLGRGTTVALHLPVAGSAGLRGPDNVHALVTARRDQPEPGSTKHRPERKRA
jgi:two-component system, cell cycle sensor histidine kinase DivJ